MKLKTLAALAGFGGALILSREANAAYTGLSVMLHTTVFLQGASRSVYRVYANFDDPGDYVATVYGDADNALTIQNTSALGTFPGSNFFNGLVDLPPVPAHHFSHGTVAAEIWATFMTIGIWNSGQGSVPVVSPPGFPAGFPFGFISGASLTTNIGSWSIGNNPLATPQGTAGFAGDGDPALRVGLMQLTVNSGQNVRGTINFQFNPAGSPLAGGLQNITGQTFDSFIPAPGALALLGFAGLAGSRRRRA